MSLWNSTCLLPTNASINVEGLYNEYYFDTGCSDTTTDQLLESTFTFATTKNVLTTDQEIYLNVSFRTKYDGINERKQLNLVVVLDVSGSMSEHFSSPSTNGLESIKNQDLSSLTKIDVAKQVVKQLINNLKSNEQFGLVLFNSSANLLQPLRKVTGLNMNELYEYVDQIRADGGTNMECGMKMAVQMFSDMLSEYEIIGDEHHLNHILFLTDAQPNLGGGKESLIDSAVQASKLNIFVTYVGVGLDFNSELVYQLTKTRGSNYYSVHSNEQFRKVLNDDFNYIINPIAFDIMVLIESEKYEIEKVYGIPKTGMTNEYFTFASFSPSSLDNESIRGCILVKLKEKIISNLNPSSMLKLTTKFDDIDDKRHQSTIEVDLNERLSRILSSTDDTDLVVLSTDDENKYENTGIRKAILLAQYVSFITNVLTNIQQETNTFYDDLGKPSKRTTSQHSDDGNQAKLKISKIMKHDLIQFRKHFLREIDAIGDKNLEHELDILDKFRYAEEI
ncbi:unnamed protein product [Didymodactylos carnosus]|uniref:VWFA domain-containing protein n=1 Tax=Didymodactylos carnosus TaxID=1234261 RepID=A0A814PQL7_9BILA|nr:unnamed protein product [Didymodactylos carnosus]CAF1109123.1 unnamed protein product [Didymodactylos carnosus]CAF3855717.1 unnamed protein product [Didymodactylos carnosus]CAF3873611.1 unnamed protein product [Didymodactylos carnosus]